MWRVLGWLVSHALVGTAGFAAGIYFLPILTAPPAPAAAEVQALMAAATFKGTFSRDLAGSDALHWGEGEVSLGPDRVALMGKLAPGPDYKLYLSPSFVQTEAEFEALKPRMLRVGDVKTFGNFIVPLPADTDLTAYDTVVIWCEAFSEFITAARYR